MKLVVNSFGQAVLVLAVLMAITGAFAIYADGAGASMAFLLSALMSAFFGGGLMLSTASRRRDLNKQESYFLLFHKAALSHPKFQQRWRKFVHIDDKEWVVLRHEVGLTSDMISAGLRCRAVWRYSFPKAEKPPIRWQHFATANGPGRPSRWS